LMNKNFDQRPRVGRRGGVWLQPLRKQTNMRLKLAWIVLGFLLTGTTGLLAQPTDNPDTKLLNTSQLDNQKWYYDLDSALANPDKVYKLSLIDQKIKVLPSDFGKLRNLQILNLSNCKLKRLPVEIKECKNLQMISLYGNKLKYLPSEMRELKQLEILYLGKNKLFEIPQWFGTMTKIRRLDISRNRLTPADVANAKRMLPKADITN
jgi:Leucine-rich repeat (LRR) protein